MIYNERFVKGLSFALMLAILAGMAGCGISSEEGEMSKTTSLETTTQEQEEISYISKDYLAESIKEKYLTDNIIYGDTIKLDSRYDVFSK